MIRQNAQTNTRTQKPLDQFKSNSIRSDSELGRCRLGIKGTHEKTVPAKVGGARPLASLSAGRRVVVVCSSLEVMKGSIHLGEASSSSVCDQRDGASGLLLAERRRGPQSAASARKK
jgi:hypothetical protein